ncbi:MAG: hypothetical protein MI923_18195 [Phycisphaerales bacterium]|nr:hypothetical protein [Phycisphaerales bacterium]
MGFSLLGFSGESLVSDFAETPLTCLISKDPEVMRHLHPRVSLSLHLASSGSSTQALTADETTLLGFCAGTLLDI